MTLQLIAIGALGLIVGSFLNAAIYRLRYHKSGLATGRSTCPHCQHTLAARDLIPVLSYLLLHGKCRYCSKPIGIHYPLVELTTAFGFALMAWQLGVGNLFMLGWLLLFTAVLIFLAAYDWLYGEIPDEVSLPAIGVALVGSFLGFTPDLFSAFLGLLIGGGAFLLLVVISKGKWMGGGDIRLLALIGTLAGWPLILVAILFGAFIGTAIGLPQVYLGTKKMRSSLRAGGFYAAGGYFALLYGQQFWNWYVLNFL